VHNIIIVNYTTTQRFSHIAIITYEPTPKVEVKLLKYIPKT